MTIRLAIVDDYEVVVRGLAEMLRPYAPEIELVPLTTGPPAGQPVDIALYDPLAQGRRNGTGLADLLAHPGVRRVVVYSWDLERAVAGESEAVAAHLSKTAGAEALVAALRKVHAGEQVTEPRLEGGGEVPDQRDSWPGREHGLTAREAEVIALITQGLSNQEIAERAALSINSVKSYIRSSYRKMGVTSRTNAVLWGLDHGFADRRRGGDTAEV